MDWTYRLRLRHLELLLSLAQTHNISRSAAALNTTQPALSKWLKELEADIGLPLFDRQARGLRPTRYGEALIAHARRIAAHLDAARDDLAAMRDDGSGRIVVGTSGASAGSTAPVAVLRLMQLYPDAAVELVESPIERLLERLANGELDVVVGRPAGGLASASLCVETLYADPVNVIARPGHPLLGRETIGWDDLLDYRWIVWPEGTPARIALDEALALAERKVPPRSLQCGTVTLNLTLITQSDMICFASQRDSRRFAEWRIARSVPIPVPSFGEVAMHWRNDGDHRPLLAAMLDCLRAAAVATADPGSQTGCREGGSPPLSGH